MVMGNLHHKTKRPRDLHGENNPRWKGGIRQRRDGYVIAYAPHHPYANKNMVLAHRLVMEKSIGRFLKPHEVVHHKNGIRHDNRLENLELTNHAYHAHHHHHQNTYNKPMFSPTMVKWIQHSYWANPQRQKWGKNNEKRVIDLAKKFRCGRTTILDVIHAQDAYAPARLKKYFP